MTTLRDSEDLTGQPSPQGARRADIQGLRALAVTLVILYHAGVPLSGGFTGVDIFFVVSGYVITESLLREFRTRGRLSLSGFFLRRFKRLVPAMALMVSVVAIASFALIPPLTNNTQVIQTALGALTITANVVIAVATGDYFATEAQSNPLLHTWTLSVEEQFYLVFPFILLLGLWLGKRMASPRHGAGVALSIVGGASFIAATLGSTVSLPLGQAIFGFYSPLTRAWEFAVGALLAVWGPELAALLVGRVRHVLALVGLSAIAVAALTIDSTTPFPGVWTLLPVLGTASVIAAGSSSNPHLLTPLLSWRPIGVVGDWSYSLYLWHWPLIVLGHFQFGERPLITALAVALAVFVAAVSYRAVEQPLRQRFTPRRRDVVGFVVGSLGVPVVVLGSGVVLSLTVFHPRLEAIVGNPLEESIGVDNRCLSGFTFDDSWATDCTFNPDGTGGPILLIGDSTATHYDEGLVLAGEKLNRPVSVWTGVRCIPAFEFRLVKDDGDIDERHCLDYREYLSSRLPKLPPSTFVLGLSDLTLYFPQTYYVDETTGEVARDAESKRRVLEDRLAETMTGLRADGHEVIIVQAIPNFDQLGGGFSPTLCTLRELLSDTCAPRVSEVDMDHLQNLHRLAIEGAARTSGATLIDFRSRYCVEGVCSPSRDGVLTYLDATHLSAEESRSLSDEWISLLSR